MTEAELNWIDIDTRMNLLPKYMEYWIKSRVEWGIDGAIWHEPKTFEDWIDYNVDVMRNRKAIDESGIMEGAVAAVQAAQELGLTPQVNVVKTLYKNEAANLDYLK